MTSESIQKLVENIKILLKRGEIQLALDQLNDYLGVGTTDLHDAVILQTARYNGLRREEMRGTIPRDQAQVQRAQITDALLQILEELPRYVDEDRSRDVLEPQPTTDTDLPDDVGLEKIIGANNLKQIAWIEHGLVLARSVCRVLTSTGRGTGFLIAPDILMTNNHVIPSPEVAKEARAEFNFQHDISGNALPSHRYRLDATHFHTSPVDKFDYTIVRVLADVDLPDLREWGRLDLNPDADPLPNEHVVIIQHPLGGPKQIALTANQVVSTWEHRLHYTTDTMPGSSGGPVFDERWQVIAIHHAGGDLKVNEHGDGRFINEGILMNPIKEDAGDFWPT